MKGNILITGGAGFVGSNFSIFFKRNYPEVKVYAMDNLKRRGSELNINRLKNEGIHFIHGDIRNPEDFAEADDIDLLLECSAEPSVLAGIDTPPQYLINTNLVGTINCLNVALKNRAKFIFLSTSRVYPFKTLNNLKLEEKEDRYELSEPMINGVAENGVNENMDLTGSKSFYGASKLASELMIQEYNEFYNIDAVINRCGVLAGPWQMGKVDQGFVGLWLAKHYWQQELAYIGFEGSGKQVRDVLHIEDLQKLVDWQIHNISNVNGEIFNVGGGYHNSVSLKEMTKLAQQVTGNQIPIKPVNETRKADVPVYITDNTKISKVTGWKPEKSVKDIAFDVYQWINENQKALEPILK